jgi:NNP family nitrate/nitrite transporter-like MFS transporter
MSLRADRIDLTDFRSPAMRVFHLSWLSFFLCFLGWFAVAPLMPFVRDELGLTQRQVGNTIVASVALTAAARLVVGWLCDRIGPRRTYAGLMAVSALPLFALALATDYQTFLLARLGVGIVGASFVVTQVHTTLWFAPSCVGTANATVAGWGNLGGGAAQLVLPSIVTGLLFLGLERAVGWRVALAVPAVALLIMAPLYARFTEDRPEDAPPAPAGDLRSTILALMDHRVVFIAAVYGCCFGVELTVYNVAALYFVDTIGLSVGAAGGAVACFGAMNLFARTAGGWASDRAGLSGGVKRRLGLLATLVILEGLALVAFTRMAGPGPAIGVLVVFAIFVQMAEGATFGVVPFVDPKGLGGVVGAVAAGGNLGAILFGILFCIDGLAWSDALAVVGVAAVLSALPILLMMARYKEPGPEQ